MSVGHSLGYSNLRRFSLSTVLCISLSRSLSRAHALLSQAARLQVGLCWGAVIGGTAQTDVTRPCFRASRSSKAAAVL